MSQKERLIIAGVIVFGFFIILFASSALLTSRPSLCQTCHTNETKALKKSSHKGIGCQTCHRKPGIFGYSEQLMKNARKGPVWLLYSYERPIRATVSDTNCRRCHSKEIGRVLEAKAIRVSHKEIVEAGMRCTDCHNTVAHNEAVPIKQYATLDKCVSCHNDEIAPRKCELCHVEDTEQPRIIEKPWAVVHGPTWKKTHGMGNLITCSLCHQQTFCAKCHKVEMPHSDEWGLAHGKAAIQVSKPRCYQCHSPKLCQSCHKMEMPHFNGWLKQHPQQVKKQGREVCYNCHLEESCNADCHEKHVHPGYGWTMRETPPPSWGELKP